MFFGAVVGDLEPLAMGVSHILSFYFVIVFPSIFFVSLVLPFVCSKTEKTQKKKLKIPAPCLIRFHLVIMSSPLPLKMTPEDEVFTFHQGSGETFKDAWARIMRSYEKTEPSITLSILLSNFYFGLILCYRYALDTIQTPPGTTPT